MLNYPAIIYLFKVNTTMSFLIKVLNVNRSMSFESKKSKKLTNNKISLYLRQLRKETDAININVLQSEWAVLWLPVFN